MSILWLLIEIATL